MGVGQKTYGGERGAKRIEVDIKIICTIFSKEEILQVELFLIVIPQNVLEWLAVAEADLLVEVVVVLNARWGLWGDLGHRGGGGNVFLQVDFLEFLPAEQNGCFSDFELYCRALPQNFLHSFDSRHQKK